MGLSWIALRVRAVGWGDEVVLIGSRGDQEITFEEFADTFLSVYSEINLMVDDLNAISCD